VRLSLILPTYNEAANLPELLRRVHERAHPHEVIVVDDDSPDKTWETAERLRAEYPHVTVIRRRGVKGLSSAVVDGCDAATGDTLVVMDSDLQHDPSLVVQLARKIEEGAGVAVASRYREGGGVGDWVRGRRWLSKLGTYLARKLPNVETTDPMSGFFAVRADLFKAARPLLVPEGFKILFELLAAVPKGTRLDEVPLQFQPRLHGESKLSFWVQVQFLKQSLRIGLRKIGLTGSRVFAILAVVIALLLLPRAWALRRLYVDPAMRETVRAQLERIHDASGWIMSDVELVSVEADGTLLLHHRFHARGADIVECWVITPSLVFNRCDER
jgi:glycosyltransferase involved in cell wall biosynthesis